MRSCRSGAAACCWPALRTRTEARCGQGTLGTYCNYNLVSIATRERRADDRKVVVVVEGAEGTGKRCSGGGEKGAGEEARPRRAAAKDLPLHESGSELRS